MCRKQLMQYLLSKSWTSQILIHLIFITTIGRSHYLMATENVRKLRCEKFRKLAQSHITENLQS